MIFAMMSTSRSESVTQFVRMNFSNIEPLEANFDVFQWCFTNVLPVFYQCFTSVYQCFTSVLPVFYKCLPMFHRCFTSVTLMFHFFFFTKEFKIVFRCDEKLKKCRCHAER